MYLSGATESVRAKLLTRTKVNMKRRMNDRKERTQAVLQISK